MTGRAREIVVTVLRLYWMSIGPVVLFFLVVLIVKSGSGWLTGYDLAFGLALLGIVLCRWLEFRFQVRSFDGSRVRARDLRQYMIAVMLLGSLSWTVANVMGNHVAPPNSAEARNSHRLP